MLWLVYSLRTWVFPGHTSLAEAADVPRSLKNENPSAPRVVRVESRWLFVLHLVAGWFAFVLLKFGPIDAYVASRSSATPTAAFDTALGSAAIALAFWIFGIAASWAFVTWVNGWTSIGRSAKITIFWLAPAAYFLVCLLFAALFSWFFRHAS